MPKTTRRITLDPTADDALDDVGNASGYLSGLVLDRLKAWQESLEGLRLAGWETPEILAAMDAVWSLWVTPSMDLGSQLSADIIDSGNGGDEIDARRWRKLAKQVAGEEPVARALWVLVQEMRLGNGALTRKLR